MKKLIGNKKSIMVASILLVLVMVAAGFWQYRSTPQVQAEGALSISIGQSQSNAGQPVKVAVDRQPKDTHIRQLLQQQGIDPEYTELVQDYGKSLAASEKATKQARGDNSPDPSPYGRTYRDNISGKHILETQGLPMVDADGNPLIPQWEQIEKDYQAKNNLFTLQVSADGSSKLIVRNDQPDGRKANDAVVFKPELYVDKTQQTSGSPTLLSVDPFNPNYTENVLAWDYGAVKRWMRLVEGRYHGYWLRPVDLNKSIRIDYHQTGEYKLKLGQWAVSDDAEEVPATIEQSHLIPTITYQGQSYYLISDSSTFYPDADAESTSVDGGTRRTNGSGGSWDDMVTGAGTSAYDSYASLSNPYYRVYTGSTWYVLNRSIYLFDTSGLADGLTISAATFSLYSTGKANGNGGSPTYNVYSSNPATNTALVAADYSTLGTTAYATAISHSSVSAGSYNDWTLNASGLAAISKTGVTKLGVREATYDVPNSAPPIGGDWAETYIDVYFAEQGAGYKPKLVVTYTIPPLSNSLSSTNFGDVGIAPNSTTSTGLNAFTLTNNSGAPVKVLISGTSIGNWTLSSSRGTDIAVLEAGLNASPYQYNVVVTANPSTLTPSLSGTPPQNTVQWGLQLLAPSSYTSYVNKTGTVTLTATNP